MTEAVSLDVSSESVAREVGYALLGRASDIHDNPDDEFEHVAEELRDLGLDVLDQYGEDASGYGNGGYGE